MRIKRNKETNGYIRCKNPIKIISDSSLNIFYVGFVSFVSLLNILGDDNDFELFKEKIQKNKGFKFMKN